MVKETGVKIMELNLSCPNEGIANLLCFDYARSTAVVEKVKNEIGNIPLLIKIAYFQDNEKLAKLVKNVAPNVQGISAINTIPAKVYKNNSFTDPALPSTLDNIRILCYTKIKRKLYDFRISELQFMAIDLFSA